MDNVKFALKNCFMFKQKEFYSFILTVFVAGFVLSFKDWGVTEFNPDAGLASMLTYSAIVLVLYFCFISTQKFVGFYLGYDSTFTLWHFGPLVGIVLTFMTYGYIPFLYIGTVQIEPIERMRTGKTWTNINVKDMMWMGIAGPIMLMLIILIVLAPAYFATGADFFRVAIYVGAAILFFSSLPLPTMNGMNVFFKSRYIWVTYFVFSIIFLLLILPFKLYAYLIALFFFVLIIMLIVKFFRRDKH